MKVGYARTSSIDGSQRTGLETQIEILKRHGCERIFAEEQSGTSTDNRKQLKECLEFMREGDEFTFTMVDRVCRNSYDLQVICLLYTSPSPRDNTTSRMPSSA